MVQLTGVCGHYAYVTLYVWFLGAVGSEDVVWVLEEEDVLQLAQLAPHRRPFFLIVTVEFLFVLFLGHSPFEVLVFLAEELVAVILFAP